MLFLLTDEEGRALLIAESRSKDEADRFGRSHLPEYWDSIEIDDSTYRQGAESWGVRTVRLVEVVPSTDQPAKPHLPSAKICLSWVWGPELPEDVVADNLLTTEDHRDLTLDHIARTSDFVGRLKIVKRAWQAAVGVAEPRAQASRLRAEFDGLRNPSARNRTDRYSTG
jgi:hypothetical protein